jgi:hypothetical protein
MADGAAACICILFYGAGEKYLQLARRVLNEPMRLLAGRNIEFRFGCNAIGNPTRAFLQQQLDDHFKSAAVIEQPANLFKYPMMRKMFKHAPITAPVTMWFDHDSYIEPDTNTDNWLTRVVRQLSGCDMIGSVRKNSLSTEQTAWVNAQSWKTDDCVSRYVQYVNGSWWAVKTSVLNEYDWPPTNLQQKGGDILLGELFRQQNRRLCHFRDGVRINVNDAGVEGVESRTMA